MGLPPPDERPTLSDLAAATDADGRGIRCPDCGCRHFEVVYTRPKEGQKIMRRRECRNCKRRLTTYER